MPVSEEVLETEMATVARGGAPTDNAIVTIYGVEFDIQDERDRVVVLSEQPVDYLSTSPIRRRSCSASQGAVIDPKAAVRIAPEPGGPVSLVTAFRSARRRARGAGGGQARREPQARGFAAGLTAGHRLSRSGGLAATPPILREQTETGRSMQGPLRRARARSRWSRPG